MLSHPRQNKTPIRLIDRKAVRKDGFLLDIKENPRLCRGFSLMSKSCAVQRYRNMNIGAV